MDDTILQSYFHSFNSEPALKTSSALLLGPLTTEILKHSGPEDVQIEMKNLLFDEFRYVLCCLNNSLNPAAEDSGSHWSLLVFDNYRKIVSHFDSSHNFNEPSALLLMAKLNFESKSLICIPYSQQKTSFECGINVLVNTKSVTDCFCKSLFSKTMTLHEWFDIFVCGWKWSK